MDYLYSTTTEHRKGQHLSFEHRVLIQTRLKDGWSPNKIAKGKRIDSYSDEQISQIETWCNSLPRKLLGYRTPDDLFENELDRIYSCVA